MNLFLYDLHRIAYENNLQLMLKQFEFIFCYRNNLYVGNYAIALRIQGTHQYIFSNFTLKNNLLCASLNPTNTRNE